MPGVLNLILKTECMDIILELVQSLDNKQMSEIALKISNESHQASF